MATVPAAGSEPDHRNPEMMTQRHSAGTGLLVVSLSLASVATGYARQADRAAERDTLPAPGDITVVSVPGTGVTFEMAFIPGGTFAMGSPDDEEGRDPDEGPRTEVSVSPFWMNVREVSFEEYAAFRFVDRDADSTAVEGATYVADAAARPSPPYEDPAHGLGNDGRPAAGMTQWGALQYAKWLGEKTGIFFRLPTEAEWEYACRAGGDGTPPTSLQLDRSAWFLENSSERFQPVGTKRANAWGLHDMLGNVAEWTLDEYTRQYFDTIVAEGTEDPWIMPTRLHPRTVRGGAFDDDASALRCSSRLESSMNWKRRDPQIPKSFWWNTDSPFVGFRLIRPLEQPSAEEREEFWMMVLGE